MSASVRWIRIRDKEETSLVIECEKFANCVVYDQPIRVYTMSYRDAAKCREVERHGLPYPIERSAEMFLRDSAKHGITDGARRLILEMLNGKPEIADVVPSEQQVGWGPSDELADDMPSLVAGPTGKPAIPEKSSVRAAPTVSAAKSIPKSNGKAPGGVVTAPNGNGTGKPAGIPATLAQELAIAPADVRKMLRAAGMRSPYTDLPLCRQAITRKT